MLFHLICIWLIKPNLLIRLLSYMIQLRMVTSTPFARLSPRVSMLVKQEAIALIFGYNGLAPSDELYTFPGLIDPETATDFRLLTAPLVSLLMHANH